MISMTGNTESQYLPTANKKTPPFSVTSNLFVLVTVLCLGFSCAIIGEKKSLCLCSFLSLSSLISSSQNSTFVLQTGTDG